jgi:hypothetical protein
MKNQIWGVWQRLQALLSDARNRIDEFWKKEDELYFSDPVAYRRRTDWFWTKVSMVLAFCFVLIVYWVEA